MNHLFLVDANPRRRSALGLVLTSVGGYQLSTLSSIQHLPNLTPDDIVLICNEQLAHLPENLSARVISFGESDEKYGNMHHLKIQEYPAFAEQVRLALQD